MRSATSSPKRNKIDHAAESWLAVSTRSVLMSLLLVCSAIAFNTSQASAQWVGNDSGLCPNGTWGPSGPGMMCVPNRVQQPQQPLCPTGTSYCAHVNLCCGSGNSCSQSGCIPIGAVECGGHYCQSGQQCTRNGCMLAGNVDCGNNTSCSAGLKCSRDGKSCLASDAVDCGSHSCAAGMKCGSSNQCLAKEEVDCGKGKS